MCRHVCRKISTSVDGWQSGGSRVCRPGSEDPIGGSGIPQFPVSSDGLMGARRERNPLAGENRTISCERTIFISCSVKTSLSMVLAILKSFWTLSYMTAHTSLSDQQFPFTPMGVLATGSAYTSPSARSPHQHERKLFGVRVFGVPLHKKSKNLSLLSPYFSQFKALFVKKSK